MAWDAELKVWDSGDRWFCLQLQLYLEGKVCLRYNANPPFPDEAICLLAAPGVYPAPGLGRGL